MSDQLHRVMDAIAPGCFSEHCSEIDRYEIEMMARRAIAAMPEPKPEFPECEYCEERHDTRVACPAYVALRQAKPSSPNTEGAETATEVHNV